MANQIFRSPDPSNPYGYLGGRPNAGNYKRRPTPTDGANWELGYLWFVVKTDAFPIPEIWWLCAQSNGLAEWVRISSQNPGTLTNLEGDTGGVVDPIGGVIKVLGGGSNVNTVGNPVTGEIEINVTSSSAAEQLTADTGVAVPSANNINVLGGTYMSTNASGDTLNIDTECVALVDADSGTATVSSNTIKIVGSGIVTTSAAGDTVTIAATGGSGIIGVNKVYLTTPGTSVYTPPVNLVQAYVECVGGGGGGFGSGGATSGTSGGSAGGYCAKLFTVAEIGASKSYTVGAGGAGGAYGGNAGSAGGDTTFGGVLNANGGGAGTGYGTINPGGSATGGDINIQGGAGTVGIGFETDSGVYQQISGNGGSSMYGQGGSGIWLGSGSFGAIGNSGTGYGSGPAGNFGNNGGVNIGGANGQSGLIIITEYLS